MKKLLLLGALAFSLNVFGQVPSYVQSNGLVGWWNFNGNANDASINNNHGTNNGATLVMDRFGTSNSAFEFYGAEWIEIQDSPSLKFQATKEFTISLWFNHPIDAGCLVSKKEALGSNNPGFRIHQFDFYWQPVNMLLTEVASDQFTVHSSFMNDIVPFDGNWHHYVYTLINDTAISYLDNQIIDSTYGVTNVGDNTAPLLFGNLSTSFYKGKLDDIGIWNKALTPCEIEELYTTQQCSVGLMELPTKEKVLVKIVDLLGRDTEIKANVPLIYIYNDGSSEKVIKVE